MGDGSRLEGMVSCRRMAISSNETERKNINVSAGGREEIIFETWRNS